MEEQTIRLRVRDMFCSNCESVIEDSIIKVSGVNFVKASYKNGTVEVKGNLLNIDSIKKAIIDADYTPTDIGKENVSGIARKYIQIIFIAGLIGFLYYILQDYGVFNMFPTVESKVDYITLFIVGLITSVHCISMCGGINLSVCMGLKNQSQNKATLPSLLYNIGRVISYTVVGGIVGGLGSVISFGGQVRGVIALLAGVFMIVMGVNMTGAFPFLRRFTIRLPKLFNRKNSNTPFVVGLINGLMPCGPLQAMQIYALGTGSILDGALSMFVFSVGTVPLMFSLGLLGSILKKKHADIVLKVGAILVIVLGLNMLLNGLALSGF